MPPRNDLDFLISHLDSSDSEDIMYSTRAIAGNAPPSIKEAAVRWYMLLDGGKSTFGQSMRRRLEINEVSLEPNPDDPLKISAKIVCELEVTLDMCDENGAMSHGSMTCLMDEGSAISLLLIRLTEDETERIGVSQTFNFLFHHPPPPAGSKIRIISRSVSAQRDIGCCQCEIWDIKNHRLIISGQQLQMQPSIPQPRENKL